MDGTTKLEILVAEHGRDIKALERRVYDVEKIVDSVHLLAQEMVGLTKEMQHTNDSIKELNIELGELKNKPAQRWELVIATVISATVGYLVSLLV